MAQLDEPKYIFKVIVFTRNTDPESDLKHDTIEYFVKAFSSNDALKRVILPNIGDIQISIETICSTLDIIG